MPVFKIVNFLGIFSKSLPILVLLLTGCATKTPPTTVDPLESYNRTMRHVNQAIDKIIFKPVAKTYDTITPSPIRRGIRNALSNLHEPNSAVNHMLQGELFYAISDMWRFIINSTIGLAGLFDVASHMNLTKNQQDFGLTLKKWGYQHSAYVVLPILGPSTVRDTMGFMVDNSTLSTYRYLEPVKLRNTVNIIRIIDGRADLLDIDAILDASIDPYIAERNAYLQNRSANTDSAGLAYDSIEADIDSALTEET